MLVVAHKNSLRALMRLMEVARDEDVPRLPIRTGRPLRFALDDELAVVNRRYLDDPAPVARTGALAAAGASQRDA